MEDVVVLFNIYIYTCACLYSQSLIKDEHGKVIVVLKSREGSG